jgi:hypothetical protein
MAVKVTAQVTCIVVRDATPPRPGNTSVEMYEMFYCFPIREEKPGKEALPCVEKQPDVLLWAPETDAVKLDILKERPVPSLKPRE